METDAKLLNFGGFSSKKGKKLATQYHCKSERYTQKLETTLS